MYDFDVLVLGSGPGGQKAAIAAAKLGRRVAVVERDNMIGGVCINTGTIPSKTLREAVLYLTGLSQREMYGQSYRLKDDITVADLAARTQHVIGREVDVIRSQLARNRVTLLTGTGRFARPAHADRHRPARPRDAGHGRQDRHRGRHPAGPTVHRGLRRAHDHRLRRHHQPRTRAALDGRGRRRGDRHRVRLDVRRAGHQGHRGRAARPDAGVLRPGDRRGAQVPPARPGGDVPVRRDGGGGRAPRRGRDRRAGERQEDRRRHRHVLGRPAGHGRRRWTSTGAGLAADDRGRLSRSTSTSAPRCRTSTRSAT